MNAIEGLRHAALYARTVGHGTTLPNVRSYDKADAALQSIRYRIFATSGYWQHVFFKDDNEARMFLWLCALMLEDEK